MSFSMFYSQFKYLTKWWFSVIRSAATIHTSVYTQCMASFCTHQADRCRLQTLCALVRLPIDKIDTQCLTRLSFRSIQQVQSTFCFICLCAIAHTLFPLTIIFFFCFCILSHEPHTSFVLFNGYFDKYYKMCDVNAIVSVEFLNNFVIVSTLGKVSE